MNEFMFTLGENVTITCSGESGVVIAKAARIGGQNQYLVRYKASDGRGVEQWWDEDALTSDGTANATNG